MCNAAVEFDRCLISLVEHVAVLVPAVVPRLLLPCGCRKTVRSLDIAYVAEFEDRVNASQVRTEQLG